jgi:hypothetical protein
MTDVALGLNMCMDGKIINLCNPTNNQDAATKWYVDNCGGGGGLWVDTVNPYICPAGSCGVCVPTSIQGQCVCVIAKLKIPVGINCY